jgi:hypothetical protein
MSERYEFKNFNATNMVVGRKAKIVQTGTQIVGDLPKLATELESLKQALIQEASNAADYQVIAEIQAAKEAANAGDEVTIGRHLANAGRWALDVAVRIGTEMAAAAINHALGVSQ